MLLDYFMIKQKYFSRIYLHLFQNKLLLHSKIINKMKAGIHPENYRKVAFKDMSNGYTFVTGSTVDTKDTITLEDGIEYPLFKLEISYKSHPFFTGQSMLIDTAGRIDKFNKRYAKK
jgi:large subunit ribosomal protein L31